MSEEQADTVIYTVEDGIAWVWFSRPAKRNAMSPKLNRRMMEVLDEIEYREDVGVLVLGGQGTAWSAGMDLKEYFRETEANGLRGVRKSQSESYGWFRRLRWFQKPTIAMVNGWCFGGGFGPLFACDLAICSQEAKFGLSEINWGILPGGGVTKVVVDLLSMRDAMWLTLTGDLIDGAQASAMRLVNECVPADQLESRTAEVARMLLQKNPVTLKFAKDAVRRVGLMTYDEAEDYLVRLQEAMNFHDKTEGRKEGIRQFIDEKSYKPGLGAYDKDRAKAQS
ncbi:p-hydroxycinnamoyl CoA hydratase/lyase [Novosphingobium sp. 1949]|uniref:p-hydroxycinnamoyl CoA hydratase/lyase n=1 Tax=Novosphingobium organovorum TaxID=2930092 RepID=A0ABT0BAA9_9SPHN|nr:p-hydroxycinnamoyl CoA hydratase/lyase [Novosphingobium organovorum]MCJ2181788.1 p-hydroxycinnamoyl CoA hydratase/lyase [Novosphingobium organovorum]